MIRVADLVDVPRMLELLREMHGESRFAEFDFDERKVTLLLSSLILKGKAIVLVAGKPVCGLILGIVQETWFGKDLSAFEIVFYVEREKRGGRYALELLEGYKQAAAALGARETKVSEEAGINPEKVESFYSKLGFSKLGTAFLLG